MSEEKRRAKRTDLQYRLKLDVIKSAYSRDLPQIEVEVIDASSTGIGFRTEEQLMIGEIFSGTLIIWNKKRMDIALKIIRCQVAKDDYIYGSIFVGMAPADINEIEYYQMIHKDE